MDSEPLHTSMSERLPDDTNSGTRLGSLIGTHMEETLLLLVL